MTGIVCILLKNKNAFFFLSFFFFFLFFFFFFFLLFYFGHQTLYGTVFQHDNSTPHHTVPRQQQRPDSPLPSMSPDLNPVEHFWDELDRHVRGRVNDPENLPELFEALELQQEWVTIPVQVIHNLIQSMPKRCWAVIDSRGGLTPCWFGCLPVAKHDLIELFLEWEQC